MCHARTVNIFHSFRDLTGNDKPRGEVSAWPVSDRSLKVSSRDVFHHDVRLSLMLTEGMHVNDTVALYGAQGLRFEKESLLRVRSKPRVQEFDRYRPPQPRLMRFVYAAHSAGADQALNDVFAYRSFAWNCFVIGGTFKAGQKGLSAELFLRFEFAAYGMQQVLIVSASLTGKSDSGGTIGFATLERLEDDRVSQPFLFRIHFRVRR
jgi:hypothetical protein